MTTIPELYQRWVEARAACVGMEDDELDQFCDRVFPPIYDGLHATPATTMRELAMKVHAFDDGPVSSIQDELDALIRGEVWRP